MPVLPRNRAFRRSRRAKPRSMFIRGAERFFAVLFSYLPCISHPDAVVPLQISQSDRMESDEEPVLDQRNPRGHSPNVSESDDSEYAVIRSSDSLLETISGASFPDSDSGSDSEVYSGSSKDGILPDKDRPMTRCLGKAPEEIDASDIRGYAFYRKQKNKVLFAEGVPEDSFTKEHKSRRCSTPFKRPIQQQQHNDDETMEIESLHEIEGNKEHVDNHRAEDETQTLSVQGHGFSAPNAKMIHTPNNNLCCGNEEIDDSDIEELKEIDQCEQSTVDDTQTTASTKNQVQGGSGLAIADSGCFEMATSQRKTFLFGTRKGKGRKKLTAQQNEEIDRVLLGNADGNSQRKSLAWAAPPCNSEGKTESQGKTKKTGKKSKKKVEEKEKAGEKNKSVLGVLPPLPDKKFGVQMAWGEALDDEKEGGSKEKTKRKRGLKRKSKKNKDKEEKESDSDNNQGILETTQSQKQIAQNTLEENETTKGTKRGKTLVKKLRGKIGESSTVQENESDGYQTSDEKKQSEGIQNGDKKKKHKSKKSKKSTLGQKIDNILSEVLGEKKRNKEEENVQEDGESKKATKKKRSRFGRKNKVSVAPALATTTEVQEEVSPEIATCSKKVNEDIDFFDPRNRPTSKERPPCRGDPTKCGLFLVKEPITPPEIRRNEEFGHCVLYSDYLDKIHQRKLQNMTYAERRVAEEKERLRKREEEETKRELEEYYSKKDAEAKKRQKDSRWAAKTVRKVKRSSNECQNHRLILVQPINPDED